jgi:hypothetical protein
MLDQHITILKVETGFQANYQGDLYFSGLKAKVTDFAF